MENDAYLCTVKLILTSKSMKKLTEKEEEVMELIWKIGPCSPKDVVAKYPEPRPHINTIATMFQFLEKKGYLDHKPVGRGYVYFPIIEKEDYGTKKLDSVIDRFLDNAYMNVVSALVREEKVSEADLLQFLADLKRKS